MPRNITKGLGPDRAREIVEECYGEVLAYCRRHGVAELEYACRFDATGVLVARLVIMGCSCSLAVALMVAGTSAATGLTALAVALWACPPYFLSCAGSLALTRRLRPTTAPVACLAWTALCCGALLMAAHAFPHAYEVSSLGTWGMAALTLLLSAKMRSTMPVAVIPMAIAFLGLFAIFITPLGKVASLTPMATLDYTFARVASYAAGPVVFDLPALAALVYATMLVVLTPLACRAFKRHQAA